MLFSLIGEQGPQPQIQVLSWQERQRLFIFNSRSVPGRRFVLMLIDRVRIKPAVCMSYCRVPSGSACSEIAPADILVGWHGFVPHFERITKIVGRAPRHDMTDPGVRCARWKGNRHDLFLHRIPACNVHLCLPPSACLSSDAFKPGQPLALDGFSVQILVDDAEVDYNSLTAARSWGTEHCPSFWPAALDLEKHADEVAEVDEEAAREMVRDIDEAAYLRELSWEVSDDAPNSHSVVW